VKRLALLATLALCCVPARAASHRRILLLGDSEACAVAPYVGLAQSPGDEVAVACKASTRVEYWGAQGHAAAALAHRPRPDAVVVFLGTNHYWERTAPDVASVIDPILAQGTQCVWAGNAAVRGRRWPMDALLRSAVGNRCAYLDTEALGVELADGVHPTPAGATKWLRATWALLK
jgi:lysophospholipase L1-like esterase